MHPVYKSGIWHTKLAFRFQICSFQFTNKHLALQTGASDYNSATENLENLVKRKLFSYRLYKLILKNKIPELQSVYNNKTVFERFFKSGILYYQKVYGKIKLHGIEEVYQKLWKMIDNQDLSTIETYIESYVKNKADISETPLLNYAPKTVREIEREILGETLKNGDTVQNMCKQLGISRSSFYRKVKKYQLDYKMSKKNM